MYACSRFSPTVLFVLSFAAAAPAQPPSVHPRLIIHADDVHRIRHACGIGPAIRSGQAAVRFGARAAEFNAVRSHIAASTAEFAMPGDAAAAAFLLLMRPADLAADRWRKMVETQLGQPVFMTTDVLELILALDWSWDRLAVSTRLEFIRNVRELAEPLTPADSPLDHRVFRRKLASLALAIVVDESDHPSPAWAAQRAQLVHAAESYFKEVFPRFIAWRGLTPTTPAAAALEESDTALAIELSAALSESDVWRPQRGAVGRWLEHYVLAAMSHPALQHQFLHDSAAAAPLTPNPAWDELTPITAHLIASRSGDPCAARLADRIETDMRSDPAHGAAWRWVPIVFETRGLERVDAADLPLARNLAGSIVFRGDDPLFPTAVWIEACQPYLRADQHFDAGSFLFQAGGHLTVNAGPDIALESTQAKGGGQFLGKDKTPFDFSQFATSSIAHNCIVIWDATHLQRWNGRIYVPRGGQRPIDGTCRDFAARLDGHERSTGSLIAYGHDEHVAYAALDLQPAYSSRSTERITREYVFFWNSALLIIDRLRTAGSASVPIAIVNLPARPKVEGRDLPEDNRIAGTKNDAGIWEFDNPRLLDWAERDGRMQAVLILPEQRLVHLAGGPAERKVVREGPAAGRSYIGGDRDSFERLVTPAATRKPRNAWYTLGSPTLLGPQFGRAPLWGRLEIRAAKRSRSQVFATLLVATPKHDKRVPAANVAHDGGRIVIRITFGDETALFSLPDSDEVGGTVQLSGSVKHKMTLPDTVQPDQPLKTVRNAAR